MNLQYSSRQATEETSGLVKEFFSSLLGPSRLRFMTVAVRRNFRCGSLLATFSKADARDIGPGDPHQKHHEPSSIYWERFRNVCKHEESSNT